MVDIFSTDTYKIIHIDIQNACAVQRSWRQRLRPFQKVSYEVVRIWAKNSTAVGKKAMRSHTQHAGKQKMTLNQLAA